MTTRKRADVVWPTMQDALALDDRGGILAYPVRRQPHVAAGAKLHRRPWWNTWGRANRSALDLRALDAV